MKESELDGLQKSTLAGKIFYAFSLQDWKAQLRLIDSCYNGHQNMVPELLKAPDEISPLFIFRIKRIAQHLRGASWPLRWRLVFFPDWLRSSERIYFAISEIAQIMGIRLRIIGISFRHFISFFASRMPVIFPLRRVECWPVWVRLYLFGSKKKSCCSAFIRRASAPRYTLTYTSTDTHSYTQHGNKPYAKYALCIYIPTRCN